MITVRAVGVPEVGGLLPLVLLALLGACDPEAAGAMDGPRGRSWTTPPRLAVDGGVVGARLPRTAYRGGPFLRNPEITTVTFAGDDPDVVTRLERFGDVITRTPWWREVVEDYCVGSGDCVGEGRPGRHVRLERALPPLMQDFEVEGMLAEESRRGPLARLRPDALVLIYLPARVSLQDAWHGRYCEGGARAYHRMLRRGTASFAFAVMPRCGDEGELTGAASHEILEATTSPDPQRHGFAFEPGSLSAAFTAAGTEPVDPCGLINRDRHGTVEGGFAVQRAWSNRAAEAGHDPCVPAPPEAPYLAAVPDTSIVRLAVGTETTLRLEAAADRAVPAWTVSALDLTGLQAGAAFVDAKLDRAEVRAGEDLFLTVRLLRAPRGGRVAVVGIVSTLGAHAHLWPLAVNVR